MIQNSVSIKLSGATAIMRSSTRRCVGAISITASLILIIAGFIKLLSACGNAKYLGQSDPLLILISNRDMMCLAGVFEIAVGLIAMNQKVGQDTRGVMLIWVASLFCVYRLGLWGIGYSGPCPCFGSAYRWLGIDAASLDTFAKLCIVFISLSGILLFLCSLGKRQQNLSIG